MITRQEFFCKINPKQNFEEAITLKKLPTIHSSEGPGTLNKYDLMENPNANCFLITQVVPPPPKSQKAILLLDNNSKHFFVNSSTLTFTTHFLIAAIDFCETYVWPGADVLFSKSLPCKSLNEAMEVLPEKTALENKTKVMQALHAQGIPSHEYLIIDEEYIQNLIEPEPKVELFTDEIIFSDLNELVNLQKEEEIFKKYSQSNKLILKNCNTDKILEIKAEDVGSFRLFHHWREQIKCLAIEELYVGREKYSDNESGDAAFFKNLGLLFPNVNYLILKNTICTRSNVHLKNLEKLTQVDVHFAPDQLNEAGLFFVFDKTNDFPTNIRMRFYKGDLLFTTENLKRSKKNDSKKWFGVFINKNLFLEQDYMDLDDINVEANAHPKIDFFWKKVWLRFPMHLKRINATRNIDKSMIEHFLIVDYLSDNHSLILENPLKLKTFSNLQKLELRVYGVLKRSLEIDISENTKLTHLAIKVESIADISKTPADFTITIVNSKNCSIESLTVSSHKDVISPAKIRFKHPLKSLREVNFDGLVEIENNHILFKTATIRYAVLTTGNEYLVADVVRNQTLFQTILASPLMPKNLNTFFLACVLKSPSCEMRLPKNSKYVDLGHHCIDTLTIDGQETKLLESMNIHVTPADHSKISLQKLNVKQCTIIMNEHSIRDHKKFKIHIANSKVDNFIFFVPETNSFPQTHELFSIDQSEIKQINIYPIKPSVTTDQPIPVANPPQREEPSKARSHRAHHFDVDTNFTPSGLEISGEINTSFYPAWDSLQTIVSVAPFCKYANEKFHFPVTPDGSQEEVKLKWISRVEPKKFTLILDDLTYHAFLSDYAKAVDLDKTYVSVSMQGNFTQNTWYALHAKHSFNAPDDLLDIALYHTKKVKLAWLWDALRSQWFFKSDMDLTDARFIYYYKIPELVNQYISIPQWISSKLLLKLKKQLQDKKLAPFLFDTHLTTFDKLQLLHDFIVNLTPTDANLTKNNITRDLDKIIYSITHAVGCCRHRSVVFFFLSALLNIQTRLVSNGRHNWIHCVKPNMDLDAGWEIINSNKSLMAKGYWLTQDLGGATPLYEKDLTEKPDEFQRVLTTPVPTFTSAAPTTATTAMTLSSQTTTTISSMSSSVALSIFPALSSHPKFLEYKKAFAKYDEKANITELSSLFKENNKLAPLVCFLDEKKQDAFVAALFSQTDLPCELIYVNRAKDLKTFFKTRIVQGNDFVTVDGIILQAMDNVSVNTLLVIQCNLFSSGELGKYHELVDEHPQFHGRPLPSHVRVLLLTSNEDTMRNEVAFASRCQFSEVNIPFVTHPPEPLSSLSSSSSASERTEVDLYHAETWKQDLLGDLVFHNKKITLEKSDFLYAVEQKKPIAVLNPPNAEEFKNFQTHLQLTKRIHSEAHAIPVTSVVEIKECANALLSMVNVVFSNTHEAHAGKMPIHLSLLNWHTLLEEVVIEDNFANTTHSLLKHFRNDKEVFVVDGFIPRDQWLRCQAEIIKRYPDKQFTFYLRPEACIEQVFTNDTVLPEKAVTFLDCVQGTANLIASDDYFLTLEKLKENLPTAHCVPVSIFTKSTEVLYVIQKKSDTEKQFELIIAEILQDLLTPDKVIILYGELAPSVYYALYPLLEGNRWFRLNGEFHEVKGRLIWNTSKKMLESLPIKHYAVNAIDTKDYQHQLQLTDAEFQRYSAFFNVVERTRKSNGIVVQPINYPVWVNFKAALAQQPAVHAHNALKSVFHYQLDKHSKEYAYLSVISKCLFHSNDTASVRARALSKWINPADIEGSLKQHFWLIMNCFRGEALLKFFSKYTTIKDIATLDMDFIPPSALIDFIKTVLPIHLSFLQPIKNKQAIAKQKLTWLLANPDRPMIFLKGAPGSGKTYTVRHLKNELGFKTYDGESMIVAWLNAAETGIDQVLLLDEFNCKKNHYHDFLYAMVIAAMTNKKEIYYNRKFYRLKPHHKVVMTGNPEFFPNREHHQLSETAAATLYSDAPENATLRQSMQNTFKDKTNRPLLDDAAFDELLHIHARAVQLNPTYYYSLRDMEQACHVYVKCLQSPSSDASQIKSNLHLLALECYAGTFYEEEKRYGKLDETVFSEAGDNVIKISEEFMISDELSLIHGGLLHLLTLRQDEITGTSFPYKHGMLIEGESGFGKSAYYRNVLKAQGFEAANKQNENQRNIYHELTVQCETREEEMDPELRKTLIHAYCKGQVIILNEVNLNKKLEELLNQLLSGENPDDPEKKLPLVPGFLVLGSQNPGDHLGRDPQSAALKNRLVVYNQKPLSKKGMISIAKAYQIEAPEMFVEAYLEKKKENPKRYNMRIFYQEIKVRLKSNALQVQARAASLI